jgi:hypothetical protein
LLPVAIYSQSLAQNVLLNGPPTTFLRNVSTFSSVGGSILGLSIFYHIIMYLLISITEFNIFAPGKFVKAI